MNLKARGFTEFTREPYCYRTKLSHFNLFRSIDCKVKDRLNEPCWSCKGGVLSFANKLTRLKNIPDKDELMALLFRLVKALSIDLYLHVYFFAFLNICFL